MRFSRNIFIASLMMIAAAATSSAAVHSVKANLDSAYLLMGKQTMLHLEIVEDAGTQGALIIKGDTLVKEVEVIAATDADTIDLGNNRMQINRHILIQSFDSGLYTLPPIPYVAGADTSFTEPLTLKVIPVAVDSLSTINGYAGAVAGDTRWWDWIPDWLTDYWAWYLVGLALIAGGIVAWLLFKEKGVKILPAKKPLSPYELALNALNALRERHLCEQGQEREFYTTLTDILRDYLERRFGINAMEMTSSQILRTLQSREDTRLSRELMQQVLEIADFVKFAKMRPLPDDNVKAFNSAVRFVEDTKPAETDQSSTDQSKTSKDPQQ